MHTWLSCRTLQTASTAAIQSDVRSMRVNYGHFVTTLRYSKRCEGSAAVPRPDRTMAGMCEG